MTSRTSTTPIAPPSMRAETAPSATTSALIGHLPRRRHRTSRRQDAVATGGARALGWSKHLALVEECEIAVQERELVLAGVRERVRRALLCAFCLSLIHISEP